MIARILYVTPMPLNPESQPGDYDIISKIGDGGIGEVSIGAARATNERESSSSCFLPGKLIAGGIRIESYCSVPVGPANNLACGPKKSRDEVKNPYNRLGVPSFSACFQID